MFCKRIKIYYYIPLILLPIICVLFGVACSREKPAKVTDMGKQSYHMDFLNGYIPKENAGSIFIDENLIWSFELGKDQVCIASFGVNNGEHHTYLNHGFKGEAIDASINRSGVMSVLSLYSSGIVEDDYYLSVFPAPGEAPGSSFSLKESLNDDFENIPVVHVLSNMDMIIIGHNKMYLLNQYGELKEKNSVKTIVSSFASSNGIWTIDVDSQITLYSNEMKSKRKWSLPDLGNAVISGVEYINDNQLVLAVNDELWFCDSNNAIQVVKLSDYSISDMSGIHAEQGDDGKTEIIGLACFYTVFGDDSYQMIQLTENPSADQSKSEVRLAVIGQKYDLEPLVNLYNACSEKYHITIDKITSDEDCQNGVLSAEQVAAALAKLKTNRPDIYYYGNSSFSHMSGFDFVPIKESLERNTSISLESLSSAFDIKSKGDGWMPFYSIDGISIDSKNENNVKIELLINEFDETDYYEYLEDLLYYYTLSNYSKSDFNISQITVSREKAIQALNNYRNRLSNNSANIEISYIQGINTSDVLRRMDNRIVLCGLPVYSDTEYPQFQSLGEFYISRDTKKLEAAEDFMRFIFSDHVQTMMCVNSYKAFPVSKQAIKMQASFAWMKNQYLFSDDSKVIGETAIEKKERCHLAETECVEKWLEWFEHIKAEHNKNEIVSYIIKEELFRFEDNITDEQECLDSIQNRSNLYFSEVYG